MFAHPFIIPFLDEFLIPMHIDMKILIQFNNTFEHPGLLFYGLGGNLEFMSRIPVIIDPVLLVVFPERIDNILMMEHFRLELILVEITMGLKIIHRPVEDIYLFRPGYLEFIRKLLGDKILRDR